MTWLCSCIKIEEYEIETLLSVPNKDVSVQIRRQQMCLVLPNLQSDQVKTVKSKRVGVF